MCVDRREADARLRFLVEKGLKRRFSRLTAPIRHRIDHELNIISQKEFADYFLLVHEIVTEAEGRGYRVLGRGSAANSLVSYALGMTHVNPLRYNL